MTRNSVFTFSELAAHARGKTLAISFGAEATTELPASGTLIVFGKEFQGDQGMATQLSQWTHRPGRLVILCPPFARQGCVVPIRWHAKRFGPVAGGDTKLSHILASERQHHFEGSLLPLERIGGAVTMAGWRKHPAAGLLTLTSLPLWSLTSLEHEPACTTWLDALIAQAGQSQPETEVTVDASEQPDLEPHDWAMLLHHCTGPFEDREDSLRALDHSTYFYVEEPEARKRLDELTRRGLVNDRALTDAGEALINASTYAVYASEFRRMNHVR
jgi:hypothetical protein